MFEIKKSSFYPVESMDNKHNYKRWFIVNTNGMVTEHVFLDVTDPSHRE